MLPPQFRKTAARTVLLTLGLAVGIGLVACYAAFAEEPNPRVVEKCELVKCVQIMYPGSQLVVDPTGKCMARVTDKGAVEIRYFKNVHGLTDADLFEDDLWKESAKNWHEEVDNPSYNRSSQISLEFYDDPASDDRMLLVKTSFQIDVLSLKQRKIIERIKPGFNGSGSKHVLIPGTSQLVYRNSRLDLKTKKLSPFLDSLYDDISFSPSGKRFATLRWSGRTNMLLQIWNADSLAMIYEEDVRGFDYLRMQMIDDENILFANRLRSELPMRLVYNYVTKKWSGVTARMDFVPSCVRMSADRKLIASYDMRKGVSVHRASDFKELALLPSRYSEDYHRVLKGELVHDNWGLLPGRLIFSPDSGRLILSMVNSLEVFELKYTLVDPPLPQTEQGK